jgi:hypothetical protein
MGMKAYFMIDVADEVREEGRWADAESELETIPEVETIEPVSGSCDFLVKADVPIRAIFVANKIRAMEWVKRLRILRVEPVEAEKPTLSELVAEQRKSPKIRDVLRSRARKG